VGLEFTTGLSMKRAAQISSAKGEIEAAIARANFVRREEA
jgi:hypothetical protein